LWLEANNSGEVMHYFRIAPTQVRVHEGPAVVTGTSKWRFTWNG
jgi:hypothetical protein